MTPPAPEIQVYLDPAHLAHAVAEHFIQIAQQSLARRKLFSVALAGGSTPQALYTRLSISEIAQRLDWHRIHVFWGDERCVSPDHPESNYGMARQALLEQIPIPPQNVHRMAGELDPVQAAQEYERQLRSFFTRSPPKTFDLVLLGMGEDGHTASLFPGSAALAETHRWVVAVEHTLPPQPLVARLTLTLPALNAARWVLILVTGAGKANRLAQALTPLQPGSLPLPVQQIAPLPGKVLWLVDAPAAAHLNV